ncbi:MAG: hypothetical protein OXG33_03785 [Chloroflexi bacterium]|nr:hypothetical protein [Chloroflexota bacterium]
MTARHFGRLLPVALLMAVCTFALTGCIRVELSFTVEEDGSGVVDMVVAVDESLLAAADESPEDMLGDVDDLPPGAVVDAYREDGFVGQRMRVPVADMELAAESLGSADDLTDAADFGFVRESDGWRFTMDLPPLGEELAGENGDFAAGMTAAIVNTAEFRVRVSLPGEITEHNADRIENGALVWELDFLDTEARTLSARSQTTGVGPVVVVVVGGAAAAAVVLAALAARSAVRARRRA